MVNSSNLLDNLIKYIHITRKGITEHIETVEITEKIKEIREKSLDTDNYKNIYIDDYIRNNNKVKTTDSNNFHIINITPLLHFIICDEVTKIEEGNAPSMCDYLILEAPNSDFIVMCELKKIQATYYDKELDKAKTQLQNTFDILQKIYFTDCEVYGVIGMISSIAGSLMQTSYQRFTFKNKRITLQSLDNKRTIETYITNSITINHNKPYISFEKKRKS